LSDEVTKNGNFIGQAGVNMFVNNGLLKTMLILKRNLYPMEDKRKALMQFVILLIVILVITIVILKLLLMSE